MIQLIVILITLIGLAIIVDNFLVPAVYRFKDIFNWTDDQTGTIISFVSSAPELSVSAVALFLAASSGDANQASIGPGTVIGSALFSILFIVGASAWFNTKKLSWPSVIRDMVYYVISVGVVYLVVYDSQIQPWEPFILLGIFAFYSYLVSQWKKILRWIDDHIDSTVINEEAEIAKELNKELATEEEQKLSIREQPFTTKNFLKKILSYLFFDLYSSQNKKSLVKISWNIILSVAFVIFFSTLMVNNAESFARLLGISPVIISLTILAAGTSVPDLLASVKTAREGFGDTAIANAVGSNIFDILANLGLTWSIGIIISKGKNLPVDTNNLNSSIVLLLAATISLVLVMIAKKFNLGRVVSVVLMLSYILYVIYQVLLATGKV